MRTINADELIESLERARQWHIGTPTGGYDHNVAIAVLSEIIDAVTDAIVEPKGNQP